MSNKVEVEVARSSTSITGLLGVVFVTLKLCGVINWSWWWVTLPFWGGAALVLGILLTIFLVTVFIAVGQTTGKGFSKNVYRRNSKKSS